MLGCSEVRVVLCVVAGHTKTWRRVSLWTEVDLLATHIVIVRFGTRRRHGLSHCELLLVRGHLRSQHAFLHHFLLRQNRPEILVEALPFLGGSVGLIHLLFLSVCLSNSLL